jgi:hypothetical protein
MFSSLFVGPSSAIGFGAPASSGGVMHGTSWFDMWSSRVRVDPTPVVAVSARGQASGVRKDGGSSYHLEAIQGALVSG